MSMRDDFIALIKKQLNIDIEPLIDEKWTTRNYLSFNDIDRYKLHDIQWFLQSHPKFGTLIWNGGLGYGIKLKRW